MNELINWLENYKEEGHDIVTTAWVIHKLKELKETQNNILSVLRKHKIKTEHIPSFTPGMLGYYKLYFVEFSEEEQKLIREFFYGVENEIH